MTNLLPPEFEEGWRQQIAVWEQEHGAEAVARLSQLQLGPGQDRVPGQQPTLAYLPGLSAEPWWQTDGSSEISALTTWMEDRFDTILQEATSSTQPASEHVEQYPHLTLGGEMAGGWDVVFLCKSGIRAPEVIERHPTLSAMLDQFPRAGTFECFMSRLAPGTHLLPHCGTNNLVLTIHLPLVIPEGDCAIRVHDEVRKWEQGRSIIFDDSFEHEAWNRTGEQRLALLVSFLHPDLTEFECQAISEVMPVWSQIYEDLLAAS